MFKEWLQKITDIIMPLEPLPEETVAVSKVEAPPVEAKAVTANEAPVKRVATGGGEHYPAGYVSTSHSGTMSMNGVRYTAYADASKSDRPNLKLVKAPEFAVKIYKPADYNQVAGITDDVLNQRAVIVNYENVNPEEQRRICDFIDGACYAVDGTATKISERIFLYAPAGIDASDLAALVAAAPRYH